MELLYLIGVKLYGFAIRIASLFNRKARLWVRGRHHWKKHIESSLGAGEKRIHVHCPSLGEFEQGKPVLEALREGYPGHKIVLTFFSPSGFEVRRKDPLADYVFYLPLDGPRNARTFLRLVNPVMVFFVKYDFWHFYIQELRKAKIPLYFVSSIFRPSQIFFRPYGTFFRKMLKKVSHFFVQNQDSLELLYQFSISQVTVTGDTRFDRVYRNSLDSKDIPLATQFRGNKKLLVAGSTWPEDESVLEDVFYSLQNEFRLIIAPHETGERRIRAIERRFAGLQTVRYSAFEPDGQTPDVMIMDNVGLLSSLYKYADVAYVGGGFGKGIHNILEAAVFGIPVFFGPRYQKFREAKELIHWKGAISIKSPDQLEQKIRLLFEHPESLERIRDVNIRYIDNNKGATNLILDYLKLNLPG